MLLMPAAIHASLPHHAVDLGVVLEVVGAGARCCLFDPWVHSHIGILTYVGHIVKSIVI